jgi:Asp-tRNA(Asn)/Glu-tRNA(Gln) amidotransferase A subunit family amidase
MPTLWSVLAAHPAALALAAAALAPGFANGSIAAAARALSRRVEQAVSALPMAPAPVPDRAVVLHLQRIAPFFAAPPIEATSGDLHAATRAATRFTFGGGLAGIPGLALPCGFDAAGLPIGVLFEAAWGHETTLLRIGEAWQQASDWHLRRPAGLG